MNQKKKLALLLILVVSLTLGVGCSDDEVQEQGILETKVDIPNSNYELTALELKVYKDGNVGGEVLKAKTITEDLSGTKNIGIKIDPGTYKIAAKLKGTINGGDPQNLYGGESKSINLSSGATAPVDINLDVINLNPRLTEAVVENAAPKDVVLTMSEVVTASGTAGFTVKVNGSAVTINSLSGSGSKTLTLTLANAVQESDIVNLEYSGSNVTDEAGNELADISGQAVTNNVVADDTTPPAVSGAQTLSSTKVQLSFDESLSTTNSPDINAFTISGVASGPAITGTEIVGTNNQKVELTLDSQVMPSDNDFTVDYEKTGTKDLQDSSGNKVSDFSQTVTNNVEAITFHFALPSWGRSDTVNLTYYQNGVESASGLSMEKTSSWYEIKVPVEDASAETTFTIEFIDDSKGETKYLKNSNFKNLTYITSTENIWIDASDGSAYTWSGDNYWLPSDYYSDTKIDIVAPSFSSGPSLDNITETSFDVTATLDEKGTVYYVVVADGATAPSASQVKAGTDANDGAPIVSGNAVDSGTGVILSASGLTSGTNYDVYLAAEDEAGNLQSNATLIQERTNDNTAPTFTAGPGTSNVGQNSFDITATLDEKGAVYYVVVADGATAPNVAQVKAGTDASDSTPAASGNAVDSGSGVTMTASGLRSGTAYDVYVVAEDDESTPNEQSTTTQLDETTSSTADTTPPSFESGPTINNKGANNFDIAATLDEGGTIYYVALNDGAAAPTAEEVKSGTGSGGATAEVSGNTVASSGTEASMSATGLTSNTAYDVYVIAEDDASTPNLQASPVVLDVTTYPNITIDGTKDADYTTLQDSSSTGSGKSPGDKLGDVYITNDSSKLYIYTSNFQDPWGDDKSAHLHYYISTDTTTDGSVSADDWISTITFSGSRKPDYIGHLWSKVPNDGSSQGNGGVVSNVGTVDGGAEVEIPLSSIGTPPSGQTIGLIVLYRPEEDKSGATDSAPWDTTNIGVNNWGDSATDIKTDDVSYIQYTIK